MAEKKGLVEKAGKLFSDAFQEASQVWEELAQVNEAIDRWSSGIDDMRSDEIETALNALNTLSDKLSSMKVEMAVQKAKNLEADEAVAGVTSKTADGATIFGTEDNRKLMIAHDASGLAEYLRLAEPATIRAAIDQLGENDRSKIVDLLNDGDEAI
ncbi:MAG: hypothetical protein AAF485_28490 [Chloroflexota bacterium]